MKGRSRVTTVTPTPLHPTPPQAQHQPPINLRFTVNRRAYYAQSVDAGIYVYPADLCGRGMVFPSVDAMDSWRQERAQATLSF